MRKKATHNGQAIRSENRRYFLTREPVHPKYRTPHPRATFAARKSTPEPSRPDKLSGKSSNSLNGLLDFNPISKELLLEGCTQLKSLPDPGEPADGKRLQSRRAGISRRLPYGLEHADDFGPVGVCPATPARGYTPPGSRTVQLADRVLAIVTRGGAELVQDEMLLRRGCLEVALVDRHEILPYRSTAHSITPFPDPESLVSWVTL